MLLAVHRAEDYWHLIACNGKWSIVDEPLESGLPGDVRMWTTFVVPAEPWEIPTQCVIHINRAVWASWEDEDYTFPEFCQFMVHEYGHLLGHEDEGARPHTVEFVEPMTAPIVPECEHFRIRFGHHIITPPQTGSVVVAG